MENNKQAPKGKFDTGDGVRSSKQNKYFSLSSYYDPDPECRTEQNRTNENEKIRNANSIELNQELRIEN